MRPRQIGLALGLLLPVAAQALVVCADPNNLPFSDRNELGFENRLARILGRALHVPIEYQWWAQRRGFARQTLARLRCDLWPGVVQGIASMATSTPYYRSTYVFVTRSARDLDGLTLDDPRLRDLTIGVQLVGDDGTNTPPAHALARRGLVENVRGFTLYGDYRRPSPPAAIVRAVSDGAIDTALVWGPLAGYYASREPKPLRIEPVTPSMDGAMPMAFAISVGVRKGDDSLLKRINAALATHAPEIRALLRAYAVPQVAERAAQSEARPQAVQGAATAAR